MFIQHIFILLMKKTEYCACFRKKYITLLSRLCMCTGGEGKVKIMFF